MQPVQIRVNAAVVLVVLLLAVPLQLFLSHYLDQAYSENSHTTVEFKGPSKLGPAGERAAIESGIGTSETKGVQAARLQAMGQLSAQVSTFMTKLRQIYNYYSSWNHLKQIFFIPYRRRPKSPAKVTLRRSGSKTEIVMDEKSGSGKDGASVASSERATRTQVGVKQVPPTSPAKEVEEYLFNEVYFTHSKEPRTVRPKTLEFRVGQVVKHKSDNYHGVIVGWDMVAKTPDEWIKRYYSQRKTVIKTPHYLVLVDSHFDASGVPYHYLPQEDIELAPDGTQVRAPEIDHYFEGYSNNRHIARPWLKNIYPRD